MLPTAKANLPELLYCWLQCLNKEISLRCHGTFWKGPFTRQITDSTNPTMDQVIPLLRASALHISNGHKLVNLSDMLPCWIIYPLGCPATLILPNPHGFYYQLPGTKPAFLAQTLTCTVCIWNALASGRTDFGNLKTSQYIVVSQSWSMIKCWISNAHYSKQASEVLNI